MSEIISEFYKPIGLEDVDTAVRDWFDLSVDAHVESPTSERHKVPVIFGSSERWVSAKNTKGIRDAKGKLILPIISLRRTGFDPVSAMSALSVNIPRLTLSKRISSKSSQLQNVISERPISSRRLNDATVYEITTIPFPSNGTVSYELVIHAQYTKQLNMIIEKIMSMLEYYETPQFVAKIQDSKNEGAGNEETKELENYSESPYESRTLLTGYYFVGFFDAGMSDSGNFDEFTDDERIIRYTTSLTVPAYLHLDVEGKAPAITVQRTAFNVGFGDEQVTFVDDPYELELIFGNGKVEER